MLKKINLQTCYPENKFSRKAFIFVTAIFLLSLALKLYHMYCYRTWMMVPEGWCISELLINFEGGFVRRGLLGEILYKLARAGVSPMTVIYILSLSAYVLAFFIYARLFRKKGISWWLLLTPWLFAEVWYIVGRDFLLFSAAAAVMALAASTRRVTLCRVALLCLTALCMMIHEAFIFWGVPLAALLLMRERGSRTFGWSYGIFSIACFAVLAAFKGDEGVSQAIFDSWRRFFPSLPEHPTAAIGAIGWSTIDAAKFHLYENFISSSKHVSVAALFVRPLIYLLWFYIMVNCVARGKSKGVVAALIYVVTVCLLPMFTIFCCDYSRVYQFATFAVLAAWCIVPEARIVAAMPGWLTRLGDRAVEGFNNILKPTPVLMVFLMICVAESHTLFSPDGMFANSVAGEICITVSKVLHRIIEAPTNLLF